GDSTLNELAGKFLTEVGQMTLSVSASITVSGSFEVVGTAMQCGSMVEEWQQTFLHKGSELADELAHWKWQPRKGNNSELVESVNERKVIGVDCMVELMDLFICCNRFISCVFL
ncbi:Powdery mildew resistance protein, partial [Striga asiatica]